MNTQINILDRANELQETLIGKKPTSFMQRVNTVIFDTCLLARSDVLANRVDAPIYAIPASTGSGKSTFACSLIAAFHESDDAYTAAFITNTIREAQSVYNNLSKLLPNGVMYVHSSAHASRDTIAIEAKHGKEVADHIRQFGQSTKSNLKKHRIVVCTHALWIQEGLDGSDLGIRLFNGDINRLHIFVDEQPNLTETQDVVLSDIAFLCENARRMPDNTDATAAIGRVFSRMRDACKTKGGRFQAFTILCRSEYEKLKAIEPSKLASGLELERMTKILRFLEFASRGNCFLVRGHHSDEVVEGVRRKTSFVAYALNLQVSAGTIILDATSKFSALTKMHARVKLVDVPNVDYRNLAITQIEAPSQFRDIANRTTPRTTDEEYIRFIRSMVIDKTDPGEKVLVVLHKRLLPMISNAENYKGRIIHYCNWGTGIGSNEWRECTSVFLLSEYHMPRCVYLSTTLAMKGMEAKNEVIRSALGQNMVGSTKDIADWHRMRWLKQMATRGNVRNSDEHGVCGPMKLFTTMDKAMLINCFEELFPNTAEPTFVPSHQVERKSKPAKLDAHLSGYTEIELCAAEVAEYFGWSVKEVGKAFKSKTCETLRDIGWELIPGNGKASKPILKKTPYRFMAGPFECVV